MGKQGNGGGGHFGRRESGGGIAVGVRGETTVDRDMHTVCPPGHDGGARGRHDELGYCSSAPKASAARGGGVYDRLGGGIE